MRPWKDHQRFFEPPFPLFLLRLRKIDPLTPDFLQIVHYAELSTIFPLFRFLLSLHNGNPCPKVKMINNFPHLVLIAHRGR
jgi:hypothetical protein